MPDQATLTNWIDGMIVLVTLYTGYTQLGWIPYLKEKLSGWRPSLPGILKPKAKEPPSLQLAAEYVESLVLYFEKYECEVGKSNAVCCGELLSSAMFQHRGKDASPKT